MKYVNMHVISNFMGWDWWVWYDLSCGTWLDGWLYILAWDWYAW